MLNNQTAMILKKGNMFRIVRETGASNGGYALLFAVLAITIALSVGLSVWGVIYKEVLLTQLGRQSELAFYAAHSGIECALYEDGQGAFSPAKQNSQITCAGQTISTGSETDIPLDSPCPPVGSSKIGGSGSGACPGRPENNISGYPSDSATSTFMVLFGADLSGPCAVVRVGITMSGTTRLRHFDSRGYNTCAVGDPLRTERGLYADFK